MNFFIDQELNEFIDNNVVSYELLKDILTTFTTNHIYHFPVTNQENCVYGKTEMSIIKNLSKHYMTINFRVCHTKTKIHDYTVFTIHIFDDSILDSKKLKKILNLKSFI